MTVGKAAGQAVGDEDRYRDIDQIGDLGGKARPESARNRLVAQPIVLFPLNQRTLPFASEAAKRTLNDWNQSGWLSSSAVEGFAIRIGGVRGRVAPVRIWAAQASS